MKKFKNTTFRKDYNPTFAEFKKSHANVISSEDMEAAFQVVNPKAKNETNGNSKSATSKSKSSKA